MAQPFRTTIHFEKSFEPTQIQAGQVTDTAFRSENLWYRDNGRVENFQGVQDSGLVAPLLALTGTVSGTIGDIGLTGNSTDFIRQLQRTCYVIVSGDLYSIREINQASGPLAVYIDPPLKQTVAGAPIYLPQLAVPFDVDYASLGHGSLELYQQHAMMVVGQGPVYINGLASGVTAKARLQIGLPAGGSVYTPYDAGLDIAPAVSTIGTFAGTKNMHEGVYSIMMARGRTLTGHVGTAGPATEVTNAGNQGIYVTVPQVDAAAGQDIWVIYGSLQGLSTTSTTFAGRNGPWYKLGEITPASPGPDLTHYQFEWRNEEVAGGETAQFDNDPPPDASFLATLNDVVVLVGCQGPDILVSTGPDVFISRPGPALRCSKPADPESYPASAVTYVNPAERIVGVLEAIGKVYPMTENRLHIATLTGVDASPITTRPFWGSGFKHQQAAILVSDKIYAFSGGRPTRSGAEEAIDQEDHTFASRVQDIVASWNPAQVIVGHDPKNKAVVFIHSNDSVRDGRRISTALCYMTETERWSGLMILKHPTNATDFVVTGVVTLSGHLSLIANGKIWRWDEPAPVTDGVFWFITTPFMDAENPMAYKTVSKVEVIARTQNDTAPATVGLFKNNDLTGLAAGNTASPAGFKTLASTVEVSVNTIWRTKMRQAKTFAVRIEGIWPGHGHPSASIDEIAISGWSVMPYV